MRLSLLCLATATAQLSNNPYIGIDTWTGDDYGEYLGSCDTNWARGECPTAGVDVVVNGGKVNYGIMAENDQSDGNTIKISGKGATLRIVNGAFTLGGKPTPGNGMIKVGHLVANTVTSIITINGVTLATLDGSDAMQNALIAGYASAINQPRSHVTILKMSPSKSTHRTSLDIQFAVDSSDAEETAAIKKAIAAVTPATVLKGVADAITVAENTKVVTELSLQGVTEAQYRAFQEQFESAIAASAGAQVAAVETIKCEAATSAGRRLLEAQAVISVPNPQVDGFYFHSTTSASVACAKLGHTGGSAVTQGRREVCKIWYNNELRNMGCGNSEPYLTSVTCTSQYPTKNPTANPTKNPTANPTKNPTATPTKNPTATPTTYPTKNPTANPTTYPTPTPTEYPTPVPTPYPTAYPTPVGYLHVTLEMSFVNSAQAALFKSFVEKPAFAALLTAQLVTAGITGFDCTVAAGVVCNELAVGSSKTVTISASAIKALKAFIKSLSIRNVAEADVGLSNKLTFGAQRYTGRSNAVSHAQIGVVPGTSDMVIKASGCLVRTNFCGDNALSAFWCDTKSTASVLSKVTLSGRSMHVPNAYVKLYSDGSLQFESGTKACVSVEKHAYNLSAKCVAKMSFGTHGHICLDGAGKVTIRSMGDIHF